MGRKPKNNGAPLDCGRCRDGLQGYLDGTLDKSASLEIFMHLRDCPGCRAEHERLERLFLLLADLPDHEVPAGFDEKILAAVDYGQYSNMAAIRQERVPVFLEEEFLPAFVRSPLTRIAGGVLSLAALWMQFNLQGPSYLPLLVAVGLVPELLVRGQGLGRRVLLTRQSES